MYDMNIVECNKKRKLQSDQLDLLRPKHKCWVGSFCSEHASTSDENPVLESVHNQMVKIRTDAAVLDDRSEPESAKDSNSFIEDSDTAMSINKEAKLEADCANTYLYGRPFTCFVNWNDYNIQDNHCSLHVSTVNKVSSNEKDTFIDSEYNPSYHGADLQALNDTKQHLLELGNFAGHVYSEYAKDGTELSVEEEFEDFLLSNGVNPNMYVLSSGRWEVNQGIQHALDSSCQHS